uniref:Uncharacterized protein n=1 Tax=Glossina brevipalpis TaxID=37001 RepID=A0A1A9WLQ4_9MUSC
MLNLAQSWERIFCTIAPVKNFVRYVSRKNCAKVIEPKCKPEHLEKQPPCPEKKKRLQRGIKEVETCGMWECPECCLEHCPDLPDRLDEYYYKTSDKLKRKYQQTWIACPDLKIEEVEVCCGDKTTVEKRKKRGKGEKPKTACPQPNRLKGLMVCKQAVSGKCPRFLLDNCPPARSPPTCHRTRPPTNCQKEPNPYPSYSECRRCELDALPPVECKCLDKPSMCEVWAEFRRRLTFVKTKEGNNE